MNPPTKGMSPLKKRIRIPWPRGPVGGPENSVHRTDADTTADLARALYALQSAEESPEIASPVRRAVARNARPLAARVR